MASPAHPLTSEALAVVAGLAECLALLLQRLRMAMGSRVDGVLHSTPDPDEQPAGEEGLAAEHPHGEAQLRRPSLLLLLPVRHLPALCRVFRRSGSRVLPQ